MVREFENAAACWREILSDVSKNRNLLSVIERFAGENTDPVRVVFGTSGWRGEIGTDFTFNNVRIVTSAIIRMLKEAAMVTGLHIHLVAHMRKGENEYKRPDKMCE